MLFIAIKYMSMHSLRLHAPMHILTGGRTAPLTSYLIYDVNVGLLYDIIVLQYNNTIQ